MENLPKIGKPAPKFELPSTNGKINLTKFKGKNIILYFYPKDCTPGCTLEGQTFRDHYAQFTKLNCVIFGISRDNLKLHDKFKTQHEFPFELISDEEEVVCQLYGVIKMKNMYGKQVRGIERSTFFIDEKGILRYEWRKVQVKDHIEEVLATVKAHVKNNK